MKKILILILSISTLISCSNDDDNLSELNIRLSNVSQYDFQNVVVKITAGTGMNFENISTQQMTKYKTFETAYGAPFLELEIDGETYTIQRTDVMKPPLENGNYTYQIDVNDSQESYRKLTFTLIAE